MKNLLSPLSTAWTAVVTHKLRSFLTILGVVIGVAAVIILMSVGKGTESTILTLSFLPRPSDSSFVMFLIPEGAPWLLRSSAGMKISLP